MRVSVLYSEVTDASSPDDADVLQQVESVSRAVKSLGHTPLSVPMSLDLQAAIDRLTAQSPHLVFNLVESLNGAGRFLHMAPTLLDHLQIPYTGASSHALYATTSKILTKKQLDASNLPTPSWIISHGQLVKKPSFAPPYFVKPVWEDASVGIDDDSVVYDPKNLAEVVRKKTSNYGECLIEQYIPGREFNVSVLAGPDGPEVLPPAEMLFRDYPADKPHIVDYRAKWDEASFEYHNTIRSFDLSQEDAPLLQEMHRIALACWEAFDLRGYARVDFRVDADNHTWVLEVNANPCISPDSGFVAASECAGLSFAQVVERIIQDSL